MTFNHDLSPARVLFFAIFIVSLWQVSPEGELRAQSSQFTGHESHAISLSDAVELVKNFKNSAATGSVLGEVFSRDALLAVLNQPQCVGIRAYYGRKLTGASALVIVGIDATGADLTGGNILEYGFPCPPICDGKSALER